MRKPKLNRDGLPVDPKEWTRQDWQDLHVAIEKATRLIRERHGKDSEKVVESRNQRRKRPSK